MAELSSNMPSRLLKPKEAANFLNVSTRTLSRIIKRGDIAVVYVGCSLRLTMDDLLDYIDRNRSGSDV